MYYLQSRYYDPEVGRFLNADAYTSTGQGILGNNMFAYCGNNPIMLCDPTGTWFLIDDVVAVTALLLCYSVAFAVIIFSPLSQKLISDFVEGTIQSFDLLVSQLEILYKAEEEKRSLPREGDPNSDSQLLDDQGNVKQHRHYGEDGMAEYDIDYSHSNGDGTHTFPHVHIWNKGKRNPVAIAFEIFFHMLEWW